MRTPCSDLLLGSKDARFLLGLSVDGDDDENFCKIKTVYYTSWKIVVGLVPQLCECADLHSTVATVATEAAGAHFMILLVIFFIFGRKGSRPEIFPGKCSVWVQEWKCYSKGFEAVSGQHFLIKFLEVTKLLLNTPSVDLHLF